MVPKELIPFLLSVGIPTSGLGSSPHPHAVHKTVETFLLHHHWSFMATTLSSVMFMKPQKFKKLKNKNPNFVELVNYRLVPQDTVRFPQTSSTLPSHPTVFMHDALMYYHPSQILDLFSQAPHIQRLFASLVVPPESTFTDQSFFPDLYTFTITNNTLHYIPENHSAGSYNQPLQASSWLKVNRIQNSTTVITVTILESWGPTHSILFQRGTLPPDPKIPLLPILPPPSPFNQYRQPTDDLVSFLIPDAVELPSATFIHQPLRHRLVPSSVYNALFTYTRAVRTLRTSDPAGFVRTQSNKPEHKWVTPNAWDNLQTFALLNCSIRPNVVYQLFQNPFQNIKLYLTQHWRRLAAIAAPSLSFLTLLPQFLGLSLPLAKVKSISAFRTEFLAQTPLLPNQILPQPLQQFISFLHRLNQPALEAALLNMKLLQPPPRKPILPRIAFEKTSIPFHLPWQLSLAVTVIPELLLLTSKLFGPVSLQAQHDLYHQHLHPQKFILSWARQPMTFLENIPFLPFEPLSPPPPPTTALPPPQFTNPPLPTPLPQTPLPHSCPQPNPSPPPQILLASSTAVPVPMPTPTTSISASEHSGTPSTPADLPELHPEPTPTPLPSSPNLLMDFFPEIQQTSPDPPQQSDPTPLLSPLEADPTCVGPVLSFSSLHPRSYPEHTADFPSRLRVLPPTPLPMPQNNCLLTALSKDLQINPERQWQALQEILPDSLLNSREVSMYGLSTDVLTVLCHSFQFKCTIHSDLGSFPYGPQDLPLHIHINHTSGPPAHFSPRESISGSVPTLSKDCDLSRLAKRFKVNNHYLPFTTTHNFTTSLHHAKNLISNMKNQFDGILSSIDVSTKHAPGSTPKDKIIELDRRMEYLPPKTVPLIHIAGFAGCGKTYPIQQLLRTKPFSQYRVSTPTTELRNEWKSSMGLPSHCNWKFCTWESSLLKSTEILVIDEIYKMPRGYLDLSVLSDPALRFVIILGDPLQGEYHSTNPSSSNNLLPSERTRLQRYIDCYCWWSYRIPKKIASLFNIETFNPEEGFVSHSFAPSPEFGTKVLTNSIATANSLNHIGHEAITISSSQGITYLHPVSVLLDNFTRLLSPSNTLVALTRSKTGVEFLGSTTYLGGTNNASAMFSRASESRPINLHTFFPDIFPKLNLITSPISHRSPRFLGSDPSPLFRTHKRQTLPPHIPVDYDEDFVVINPILQGSGPDERLDCHFLPPTRLPLHSDLCPSLPQTTDPTADPFVFETPITACYPGENFENLAAFFLPAHDPELKEILFRDQASQQFPWFDKPFHLSCQPSSLIAAKHSPASDPTLLPASISKRLRFRPNLNPHLISTPDVILGNILFHSLCKAYRRNPSQTLPFNPTLFAECISINDYAQLSSKTKATIVANASRSDPDWRYTTVKIFAKAQHKVNDGSIFGSWKACQTLALMHDYVILTLGPVKKYQRFFDNADRPPHIYSHCGKTPKQLSSWCRSHLTPNSIKLANDYTAFDQSQHGEAVVLEALKMKRLNIPPHLISLHIHLKTNVSTQFGPLTCMRLTGEPGTYDDNTDYNLATIYSQYNIGSIPVMVSGDDSVIDRIPPLNDNWPNVLKLLHLRFKPESTKQSLFCGYYVGSHGALRNPLALFAKLMIAVDDCSISEKRLSYLTEFAVGHNLGDCLWNLLPEPLHKFQSACFDFFCRHAPHHEKLLLNPETPNHILLSTLTTSAKWLSKNAMYLLPSHLRKKILAYSQSQSSHDNPEVSQLESELLHHFQ